jgi:hypothetical protein
VNADQLEDMEVLGHDFYFAKLPDGSITVPRRLVRSRVDPLLKHLEEENVHMPVIQNRTWSCLKLYMDGPQAGAQAFISEWSSLAVVSILMAGISFALSISPPTPFAAADTNMQRGLWYSATISSILSVFCILFFAILGGYLILITVGEDSNEFLIEFGYIQVSSTKSVHVHVKILLAYALNYGMIS